MDSPEVFVSHVNSVKYMPTQSPLYREEMEARKFIRLPHVTHGRGREQIRIQSGCRHFAVGRSLYSLVEDRKSAMCRHLPCALAEGKVLSAHILVSQLCAFTQVFLCLKCLSFQTLYFHLSW